MFEYYKMNRAEWKELKWNKTEWNENFISSVSYKMKILKQNEANYLRKDGKLWNQCLKTQEFMQNR